MRLFRNKHHLLFIGFMGASNLLLAQEAVAETSPEMQLLKTVLVLGLILAFICLVLVLTVFALVRPLVQEYLPENTFFSLNLPSWKSIWQSANDFVPLEAEATIDMGHDYDGIRELDNKLPPWWKYGFYASIVFALIYMLHFHVAEIGMLSPLLGEKASSAEEYQQEIAEAAIQKEAYLKKVANLVDESSVEFLSDASSLTKGKEIFMTNCVACHGAEGQGGIGPNFTDEYWIHGGSVQDVFQTIKYGVPEKGMISWQALLKPREMQEVASFILSLQGTDPPNQKDPEGERYVPEVAATDSTQIVMLD